MAIDILSELRKGNVSVFEKMTISDKKITISEILAKSENKKEILDKILPIFRNNGNWYGLAYEIFKIICLDNDFKEYIFYLLHSEYVMIEEIEEKILAILINNTGWGLDYVLDNLEKITSKNKLNSVINAIIYKSHNNIELYQRIKEKILNLANQKIKDDFIISSIAKNINLSNDYILASLYQNSDEYYFNQETLPFYDEEKKLVTSRLPKFLSFKSGKNKKIRDLLLDNFDLFLKVEEDSKMCFLHNFYDGLETKTKNKYSEIYNMYLKQPTLLIDKYISIMLNNNLEEWLINFIKDKKVSYLSSGSTTSVFKVDDTVLKLSLQKHEINTVRNLYLIAPTETKIIYDKKEQPILIIEIQKYLEKTYNGIEMTKEDVNNFFEELDKLGYVVNDPRCLDRSFCNFGFLNDYHEANLGKYKKHKDLPKKFKKRPMVLFDIDLVYEKNNPNKKEFVR